MYSWLEQGNRQYLSRFLKALERTKDQIFVSLHSVENRQFCLTENDHTEYVKNGSVIVLMQLA
jgi:hypothetical protein